jgi:hypothetical protein
MESNEKILATHEPPYSYIPAYLQVSLTRRSCQRSTECYITQNQFTHQTQGKLSSVHGCLPQAIPPRSKHSILFEAAHDTQSSAESYEYQLTRLQAA